MMIAQETKRVLKINVWILVLELVDKMLYVMFTIIYPCVVVQKECKAMLLFFVVHNKMNLRYMSHVDHLLVDHSVNVEK